MEACSTAHYWGQRMQTMGLQPRLMAAEFVQAFRKSKSAKNDHNDAEAIAIAVRQPTMRFVAIKNINQQSRLAWHRVREGWKEERTALINRCRGLLLEFGYPIARSAAAFNRGLKTGLQEETLPPNLRRLLAQTGGLPQDLGRHCQQTRPAVMGTVGQGRNLRPECLAKVCRRRTVLNRRVDKCF
jgi:transposase